MKAAQINAYGGNDVVAVKDAEQPVPKEGQVLVGVRAAGVNPVDWKIREGFLKSMVQLQFPATLGGDVSGVVIEGAPFRKGDEVYGFASVLAGGSGSFAEFAAAPAALLAKKPKMLDHRNAAALPLAGASALQALEHMNLKGGKVLIHGGAGGIGSLAIQIAKHRGAHVATTVNAQDKAFAKKLGADEIIDYRAQQFEDTVKNYDAVLDTVGGETCRRSYAVLKKGGTLVSMLEQPDEQLMKKHGVTAVAVFTQVTADRLRTLARLADEKVITVNVEKTFPLGRVTEALAYQKDVHPQGKVVLEIGKR